MLVSSPQFHSQAFFYACYSFLSLPHFFASFIALKSSIQSFLCPNCILHQQSLPDTKLKTLRQEFLTNFVNAPLKTMEPFSPLCHRLSIFQVVPQSVLHESCCIYKYHFSPQPRTQLTEISIPRRWSWRLRNGCGSSHNVCSVLSDLHGCS